MHGISPVPGGVDKNLSRAECDRLLHGEDGLPSIDEIIDYAQDWSATVLRLPRREPKPQVDGFANVPALNMSLVDADGNVDYYDGALGSSTSTRSSSVSSTITTTSTTSPRLSRSGPT